jgi:hypothetical protein
VQLTFLLTIEKSNAATATVLQFLSPTIIVAWFALARKKRPGVFVLSDNDVACRHVPAGDARRPDLALSRLRRCSSGSLPPLPPRFIPLTRQR